jgi:hypothetical protein
MSDFSAEIEAQQSNLNAEETAFHISIARSPLDLRAVQDQRRGNMSSAGQRELLLITDAVIAKCFQFGLDMDNTEDQRIAGIRRGREAIEQGDKFGPGRHHPTDRPETVFLSAYDRLLSAIDTRSDTRLQLLPQTELVRKTLFHELAASALRFTSADQYTERYTSYPRKAARMVTDVTSPFWHFGMRTDDHPGKQFGSDGRGPNVGVWMPTGCITDESVMGLEQTASQTNQTWQQTTASGHIPTSIAVQSLRMGVPDRHEQLDTTDGLVKAFLEYAKEA